jgi:hypothetical protein
MTTFHSRKSGDARRTRKNENADMFNFASQIPSSICTVAFTKREMSDAIIFKSRFSCLSLFCIFRHRHALPLVRTRFSRLANSSPKIARSPARRSRDGRATSGKKSDEMSRVMSAQRPGNGRTVATATPQDGRADDSQDNLPWTCHVRAGNLRDDSPQISTVTSKKYEYAKHTTINARS